MKLQDIQEARYLSTEFVEIVADMMKRPTGNLHSKYIDIKAVPDAVRQLSKVFGEPHVNKNAIKDEHGRGAGAAPRTELEDNSFIAYSWEDVPGARYVALDLYTDGRSDTAEIFVDMRSKL